MERIIPKVVESLAQGNISRRQLMRALAVTPVAPSLLRSTRAAAAETSAARAISIHHVSYQVKDYARSRDFYAGLLGMHVSMDDGKSCVLTFGNTRLVLRSLVGPAPGKVGVDHIAYRLANWHTDKSVKDGVEVELKRRGLPMNMNPGDPSGGFTFKDPYGLGVQLGGKEPAATIAGSHPAEPAQFSAIRAVSIHHVSYQVQDYVRIRDFYASLLGMRVSIDDGKSCDLEFGDSKLVPRNVTGRESAKVGVDHIAYRLADWDTNEGVKAAMEAELKRRGLPVEINPSGGIKTFKDPDGLGVQLGGNKQ